MSMFWGLTELSGSDRLTQGRWFVLYLLLLASTLLTSCNPIVQNVIHPRAYIEHSALYSIPGWDAKQSKSIYSNEEVSEYLGFFIDRWQERGLPGSIDKIKESLNKVEIHWQQTKFTNPEDKRKQILLGYMYKRSFYNKISVFVYDCSQKMNPKIGDTALGHELIHVTLLAVTGSSQPNHYMGKKSEWSIKYQDFEDEVNAKFR